MRKYMSIAAATAVFLAAPAAHAVTVTGGITTVEVTADLEALGLTGAPLGTASVEAEDGTPVFTFPITGGDLDPASYAGEILHDGSGVALSAGSVTISLQDFIIDTTQSVITGTVSVSGTESMDGDLGRVPVFSFDIGTLPDVTGLFDTDDPMLALIITDIAGAALAPILEVDLSGATFGMAATDPALVPVPGALVLFVSGAAALGGLRYRRKSA
ncbi:hypothetical protein [Parvularcula oceani]|uniref:hypothetical protein n=1 Tax=Parvularcula oceani TaxID=1247963 RepID=UPI00068A7A03|nr:hypothetical protein [Parvularcula oceani]